MPKKVRKGSGITARDVTVWGGDLGEDDLLEGALRQASGPDVTLFEGAIAPVEIWADELLEHARAQGIHWRHDDDSKEDYADRIVRCIRMVRDCIKNGNSGEKTAAFAFLLGQWIGEARIKFAWEREALQGQARLRDASMGGTSAATSKKAKAAEWQAQIKTEVERLLKAGKTDQDIAGRTFRKAGRTIGTVARFVADMRKGDTNK